MSETTTSPSTSADPLAGARVALTPRGALFAFSQAEPDATQTRLQTILSAEALPSVDAWLRRSPAHPKLLGEGLAAGWLQRVHRSLPAPDVKLDSFLSHIIGGLSGERKAALAATGGFCVGQIGYADDEAETLCAAAADFSEFARRQRLRGWRGASYMTSFHEDIAMLMPTTSFVPFWVDRTDYCLVLGGEPLINNPALVELIWGIKAAGARFSNKFTQEPS